MAVKEVLELWEQLDRVAHGYLSPIKTDAQYRAALAFLEQLWDKVGEDVASPYGSLFRIITENIRVYEERFAIPDAPPERMLAYLMELKGLTQKEVEEATGIYQSNLSQILAGKRRLTTDQVKTLAEYFKVSPEVLL